MTRKFHQINKKNIKGADLIIRTEKKIIEASVKWDPSAYKSLINVKMILINLVY